MWLIPDAELVALPAPIYVAEQGPRPAEWEHARVCPVCEVRWDGGPACWVCGTEVCDTSA